MSTNEIQTQSGERLTFFQLFNEKKYQIEIPIIQRDYAQGRNSTSEIRNLFIDALYNYLEENKKHRDLDFVYGSLLNENNENDTKFIPLDGQQRLTTLFLLHWYLANKDGEIDLFRKNLSIDNKSKFTYETRTSSKEFCDALINSNIDLDNLLPSDKDKKNNISKTIQDCGWYYLSWESDPTIKSMLVMLDTIHEKFKNASNFFERLISVDNPVITFQFLNLNEFKLTDDLYIKMNARGKPLTPFENFKAKFEQLIARTNFTDPPVYKLEHNGVEKDVPVQEYFSFKIDTDWSNLFWNYRNEKYVFDDKIMNLLRATIVNHYAKHSSENNVKFLIDRDKKNTTISFQQYKNLAGFDETFIIQFIELLDSIKNGNNPIKTFLNGSFYYDEQAIFKKAIENDFDNFTQRVQFYAYCQYLIFWKSDKGLLEWMRVIHNLSENTIYNSEREFIRSIKGISKLLPFSNNILAHLISGSKIEGFNNQQLIEEEIKALLIQDDKWESAILKMEQHNYFKGQISFLLYFSGISDYHNNNKDCNWSGVDNDLYFKSFQNYAKKATTIFDENGLIKFKDNLWRRALLTKGNYLLSEGSNISFLIDFDRDISWKRLLFDGGSRVIPYDKGFRRDYIKQVFDDANFDENEIENSLRTIIKDSISSVTDWRRNFIDIPELLDYLGPKNYIRFINEDRIFLLSKERMNGMHSEYYSHSFFYKYVNKKETVPFKSSFYFYSNKDEDWPCIVISDWKYEGDNFEIHIKYDPLKKLYELVFFDTGENELNKKVDEILNLNNLKDDDGEGYYSIFSTESDIASVLNKLLSSFKNL
ncbi:DUF262 domain-containing protein [Lutibacter maritimus]|uniref:GmrSD restriction endonucleases N-terminal domain-containing protein n=1 Tax=Lutibacter maritimus TaxID=593133 RepID=A0A1I6RF13_9FLAO|nr:DUF262 domain-containing protein [Lutibacter maritimus]SFS63160.1 Protein of unknown function DUF262 [Lutibacter maritimus]